jgi:hypothetical protein
LAAAGEIAPETALNEQNGAGVHDTMGFLNFLLSQELSKVSLASSANSGSHHNNVCNIKE